MIEGLGTICELTEWALEDLRKELEELFKKYDEFVTVKAVQYDDINTVVFTIANNKWVIILDASIFDDNAVKIREQVVKLLKKEQTLEETVNELNRYMQMESRVYTTVAMGSEF